MTPVTKKFHFISDTEGWTGSAGAGVDQAWYLRQKKASQSGRHSPPLSLTGGSLRTTSFNGAAASSNYWEWSGTWEDLGATPGTIITSVNLDYLFRFSAGTGKGDKQFSNLTFGSTDAGSGPAELRTSSGSLVGTFSALTYCIARPTVGSWRNYPDSSVLDTGAVDLPASWAHVTGSALSVPAALQPSHSSIKLRLSNILPATPAYGTAGLRKYFLRCKQDRVNITMNTTVGHRMMF